MRNRGFYRFPQLRRSLSILRQWRRYEQDNIVSILSVCFVLIASVANAQTVTCLPMGQSTACYGSQGQSTIITPMGSGFYSYGNSNGQGGTIYAPPMPPTQPMPSYQPSVPPIQPLQPFNNPYAPRR